MDRGERLSLLNRRNGDEWRPTPREQAEQAVARAGVLIARYFDAVKPDRRDLERARQELDEALRLAS